MATHVISPHAGDATNLDKIARVDTAQPMDISSGKINYKYNSPVTLVMQGLSLSSYCIIQLMMTKEQLNLLSLLIINEFRRIC